jgi:hypothetical protein
MLAVWAAESTGKDASTGMMTPLRRTIGGLPTTMWMSLQPWLTALFSTLTRSMGPPAAMLHADTSSVQTLRGRASLVELRQEEP